MSGESILQVLAGGLAAGSLYALLLLGILLIYQASGAVNFSHGALAMFAAFGSYHLYAVLGWPPIVAVVAGVLAAGLIALGIDRVVVRRVPAGSGLDLVATLGVLLLLTAAAERLFTGVSYRYLELESQSRVHLGGVVVSGSDLILIGTLIVVSTAAHFVIHRTSVGVSMRATAAAPALAETAGVNIGKVRAVVWFVAGALAGVVGVLAASRLTVDAYYMTPILIKAFIAGIIGGLDRLLAPLVVAVLLGVYEALSSYALGSEYATPAVFLLIIVLLAFAPRRLLDGGEARA